MLDIIGKTGNRALRIIIGIIAFFCVFFGLFILCEYFRTESTAFTPYELSKYKPKVSSERIVDFDELKELNDDAVGWLVLYGTKIDYPVMQGKDDKEYLNKNAFGEPDISGSLYLSAINKKDLSDRYLLVYGHHMDNGGMFGDLDKYKEKEFFNKKTHNRIGLFITRKRAYDVNAVALLNTTGYDQNIYYVDSINSASQDKLLSYLRNNAVYYHEPNDKSKLIALSTCSDYVTSSRLVLVCELDDYTGKSKYEKKNETGPGTILGHHMSSDYFSFLNLLCLLVCLYLAFPLHVIIKKLIRYIRKKRQEKKNKQNDAPEKPEEKESLSDIMKYSQRKLTKALLHAFTIVIALNTFIIFYIFENIRKPMIMIDEWTPIFIVSTILAWVVQYIATRIKKRKKEDKEEQEEDKPEGNEQEKTEQNISN